MEIILNGLGVDQHDAEKEPQHDLSQGTSFWRLWEPTELVQVGDTWLPFTAKPGDVGILSLCRRIRNSDLFLVSNVPCYRLSYLQCIRLGDMYSDGGAKAKDLFGTWAGQQLLYTYRSAVANVMAWPSPQEGVDIMPKLVTICQSCTTDELRMLKQ